MPPHLINFVFLVETGFLPVVQATLELLTSGDLLASASQSAWITGMSHYAQPKKKRKNFFKYLGILPCCPVWSQIPELK